MVINVTIILLSGELFIKNEEVEKLVGKLLLNYEKKNFYEYLTEK